MIPPVPQLPKESLDPVLAIWLDNLRFAGSQLTGGSIYYNVADYGAIPDGTFDCTSAINSAITAATNGGGGVVFFPPGTYKITNSILLNQGTSIDEFSGRVSLLGSGKTQTRILATGAFPAIYSGNNAGGYQRSFSISGLFIQGQTKASGAIGLKIFSGSYFSIRDVYVYGFQKGVEFSGTITSTIQNCNFSFCDVGCAIQAGAGGSPPTTINGNNLCFESCKFSENDTAACIITQGMLTAFFGGSIENNGKAPTSSSAGGILFYGGTDGAVSIVANGVYFEDNNGLGDVYIKSALAATSASITGCTFNRLSNSNVAHNIYLANAAYKATCFVSGCGFFSGPSRTPSSSKGYLYAESNTNTQFCFFGNSFMSSAEDPTYPTSPAYVINNFMRFGADGVIRGVSFSDGASSVTPNYSNAPVGGLTAHWVRITSDSSEAIGIPGAYIQVFY